MHVAGGQCITQVCASACLSSLHQIEDCLLLLSTCEVGTECFCFCKQDLNGADNREIQWLSILFSLLGLCIVQYSQLLCNLWLMGELLLIDSNEDDPDWASDSQDQSSPCQLYLQTHNDCNWGQCPSFCDSRITCDINWQVLLHIPKAIKPTTTWCSESSLSFNKQGRADWCYHYCSFHGCSYLKCFFKGNNKWSCSWQLGSTHSSQLSANKFSCYIAYHVKGFLIKEWCNNNPMSSWIPFYNSSHGSAANCFLLLANHLLLDNSWWKTL